MPTRRTTLKTAALLILAAIPPRAVAIDVSNDGSTLVTATSAIGQDAFTLSIAGRPAVDIGRAVNLLVTVAPQAGSIQPVKLSCSGLPSESTGAFGMATLPVNGGTTTLQITTMEPHGCESPPPPSENSETPFAGPMLAGLMLLFIPRSKCALLRKLVIIMITGCGVASLTGCGSCTDLGTRPGDYTITVIATSTTADTNAAIAKIVLHVTVPHA